MIKKISCHSQMVSSECPHVSLAVAPVHLWAEGPEGQQPGWVCGQTQDAGCQGQAVAPGHDPRRPGRIPAAQRHRDQGWPMRDGLSCSAHSKMPSWCLFTIIVRILGSCLVILDVCSCGTKMAAWTFWSDLALLMLFYGSCSFWNECSIPCSTRTY